VLQFLASFVLAPVPAPPSMDRHGDVLPPGVVTRFGTVRLRASASELHLSADGKLLVGVSNSAARVFDRATGRLLRVLEPGPGSITASVLHPNGRTLYTLHGKRVVASDLETGKVTTFAEGEIYLAYHAQLAISADGKVLAAADPDNQATRPENRRRGCVRLFDTASGKCLLDAEYQIDGAALALSPDGSMFAVGLYEGLVVFDAKANKEAFRLKVSSYLSTRAAFAPDGKSIALFGTHEEYGRVELRNARTGKILDGPADKFGYPPRFRYSPDGSELWCFPADKPPVAIDIAGKKPVRPLVPALKEQWLRTAISADGKCLATGKESVIRIWDVTTGREATSAPDADAWLGAAPSPDGARVATLGREALAVWDAKTGKQLMRVAGKLLGGELRWTADGKQLTACEGAHATWWDAATGKRLRAIKLGDETVTQFTARGGKVFALTWYDEAVPDEFALDAATGKKLDWHGPDPLTPHWEDHVSPDGSRYISCVDGDRRGLRYALNGPGQRVILSFWNEQSVFAFSPDGKQVIGAGKAGLHAWDATTGKAIGPDALPDEPMFRGEARQVAVSPDGTLAAVTIAEHAEHRQPGRDVDTILTGRVLLRVYDIASGKLKADLGHFDALDRVVFMPDGKHLLAVRHGYAEVIELKTAR
jgi:WD40 repeat protein